MNATEGTGLTGTVAMVTGGGSGIGRVFAKSLAHAGATVAVTGRSADRLRETVQMIEADGGSAIAVPFDVTDEDAVNAGVAQAEERLGPIGLLVNNAADGGPIDLLWNVDSDQWWRAFETNVRGPFLCSRSVLPGMISRRSGAIINIVSHAGVHRWPLCSAYAVSKAATIKLSENLAAESERYGVSVFAFHPGLLETGLTGSLLATDAQNGTPAHQVAAWFRRQVAQRRCASPEQSAATLMALASGRYPRLSGCYVSVDDDLDALDASMRESNVDGVFSNVSGQQMLRLVRQ